MYFCEPLHTDELVLDDQLEHIYSSSVPIQNVVYKIGWKRWTIETGGENGSGKSVLVPEHDNDDKNETTCFCRLSLLGQLFVELLKKIFVQLHFI